MTGMNLLGANQWQTLQMQETTRPVAHPPARVPEPDPKSLPSQQPGIQTPTQTARAVHMEAIFDHVDLSLKDSLAEHGHGGEPRGEGEAKEEEGEEGVLAPRHPGFASMEAACDWLCSQDLIEGRRLIEAFRFTTSIRALLATLGPPVHGQLGAYAKQSILTASGPHLLARTLAEVPHHLRLGKVEEAGKLLAVLLGSADEVPGWADFLHHAIGMVGEEREHARLEESIGKLVAHLGA